MVVQERSLSSQLSDTFSRSTSPSASYTHLTQPSQAKPTVFPAHPTPPKQHRTKSARHARAKRRFPTTVVLRISDGPIMCVLTELRQAENEGRGRPRALGSPEFAPLRFDAVGLALGRSDSRFSSCQRRKYRSTRGHGIDLREWWMEGLLGAERVALAIRHKPVVCDQMFTWQQDGGSGHLLAGIELTIRKTSRVKPS